DGKLPGVERRHAGVRDFDIRYLLAAGGAVCAKNLQAKVQRSCDPRAPPDYDVCIRQTGDHRLAMQPWCGVGAHLAAVFRSVEAEALQADTLVCPLIGPGDGKAAVGEPRHRGPDE